jgi:multicomponent K+:H+ antiporter subunit E
MSKRLFPHPILSVVLMGMWLLLANDISVGNLLLGAFLGWVIALRVGERLWFRPVKVGRPDLMLKLAGHVLYDIVDANIGVAKLVLGPTSRLRPAFIEIPLEVDHEIVLTTLMTVVSLSPGTLGAELSDDRKRLLVHVLHLEDEAELRNIIKTRYEAPLREIFPCSPS